MAEEHAQMDAAVAAVTHPYPTTDPLLPDQYSDPFDPASGLSDYPTQPFLVIQRQLLTEAFGEGVDLAQAAQLFTFDTKAIQTEFARINPVAGTEIPVNIREEMGVNGGWLHRDQLQLFDEDPNLPYPPAFHVPFPGTGKSTPVISAIMSLPSAVALPMHRFLGEGLPATTPGVDLSHPIIRALSPYSNPSNLVNSVAPPLPGKVTHVADGEAMTRTHRLRSCFAQKLLYRNILAEKDHYKQMDFMNFRRAMSNRLLFPPGNFTHNQYYDPSTPLGILKTRQLLKLAFQFGGGKEALISVEMTVVKPRFTYSVAQLLTLRPHLKVLIPEHNGNIWANATYSNRHQEYFAENVLDLASRQLWQNGSYPIDRDRELPRDKQNRRSLNNQINSYKCELERFRNLDQKSSSLDPRKSYVAVIQLATVGASPLLLQVSHLSWEKLPSELQFLLTNPCVRKLVIGRGPMGQAFSNSFGQVWDHRVGVIDIQTIAHNPTWKPTGEMGPLDFARLVAFQFWGKGGETIKHRQRRLLFANYLVPTARGLDSETRAYSSYFSLIPLMGWMWITLNNPDALLYAHTTRLDHSQIAAEVATANNTRKIMFLLEHDFCSLFWQYSPDSTDAELSPKTVPVNTDGQPEPVLSPSPMIRNLAEEHARILAVVPETSRVFYQAMSAKFLKSRYIGLSKAAQDFHRAVLRHEEKLSVSNPGGDFGIHNTYITNDRSVGVQDRPLLMFSEFIDKDGGHGAEHLLHCCHLIAIATTEFRRDTLEESVPLPSRNELNIFDSLLADNLAAQLIVRGSDRHTRQVAEGFGGDTLNEVRRWHKLMDPEYAARRRSLWRERMIQQPWHIRPTQNWPGLTNGVRAWMWAQPDPSVWNDFDRYKKNHGIYCTDPKYASDLEAVQQAIPVQGRPTTVALSPVETIAPTTYPRPPVDDRLKMYISRRSAESRRGTVLEPMDQTLPVRQQVEDYAMPDNGSETDILKDPNQNASLYPMPSISQSHENSVVNARRKVLTLTWDEVQAPDSDQVPRTSIPPPRAELAIAQIKQSPVSNVASPISVAIPSETVTAQGGDDIKPQSFGPTKHDSESSQEHKLQIDLGSRSPLIPPLPSYIPVVTRPQPLQFVIERWPDNIPELVTFPNVINEFPAPRPGDSQLWMTASQRDQMMLTLSERALWDRSILPDDYEIVRRHHYETTYGQLTQSNFNKVMQSALSRFAMVAALNNRHDYATEARRYISYFSFGPQRAPVGPQPTTTVTTTVATVTSTAPTTASTATQPTRSLGIPRARIVPTGQRLPASPIVPVTIGRSPRPLTPQLREIVRANTFQPPDDEPISHFPASGVIPFPHINITAAAQMMAYHPRLQADDETVNYYMEILPKELKDYHQIERPCVSMKYIRVGYPRYCNSVKAETEMTRVLRMILELDARIPDTNEEHIAELIYLSQGHHTRAKWNLICGSRDSTVEVLRRLMLLARVVRRHAERMAWINEPGYDLFLTRNAPAPLTTAEKDIYNRNCKSSDWQYVIQMPDFQLYTEDPVGTIAIRGRYNHREQEGQIDRRFVSPDEISPQNLRDDDPNHKQLRKRLLNTALSVLAANQMVGIRAEYKNITGEKLRIHPHFTIEGGIEPNISRILPEAKARMGRRGGIQPSTQPQTAVTKPPSLLSLILPEYTTASSAQTRPSSQPGQTQSARDHGRSLAPRSTDPSVTRRSRSRSKPRDHHVGSGRERQHQTSGSYRPSTITAAGRVTAVAPSPQLITRQLPSSQSVAKRRSVSPGTLAKRQKLSGPPKFPPAMSKPHPLFPAARPSSSSSSRPQSSVSGILGQLGPLQDISSALETEASETVETPREEGELSDDQMDIDSEEKRMQDAKKQSLAELPSSSIAFRGRPSRSTQPGRSTRPKRTPVSRIRQRGRDVLTVARLIGWPSDFYQTSTAETLKIAITSARDYIFNLAQLRYLHTYNTTGGLLAESYEPDVFQNELDVVHETHLQFRLNRIAEGALVALNLQLLDRPITRVIMDPRQMARQQRQLQGQPNDGESSDEYFVVKDTYEESETTEITEPTETVAQPDQGPIGEQAGEVVRSEQDEQDQLQHRSD